MRVAFLTGHAANSHRKTGFHFFAEMLAARDVDIDWVTLGFSQITRLARRKLPEPPYNSWVRCNNHLQKFVWCPFFHPVNLGSPFLNNVSIPFFNLYAQMIPRTLTERLGQADIIFVEVGAGLLIIPALAKSCPNAKFIYFRNDRPSTVGGHPAIVAAEKKATSFFSFVRVPAAIMKNDYPEHIPVQYIPQGIDKHGFNRSFINPYRQDKNAISIGDMLFDADSITVMANRFPDWTFHLFGRDAALNQKLSNVIEYGEYPFDALIPYIKHADIGIAAYKSGNDADYINQSSLKIIQYSYCRLPVVAPNFSTGDRYHVIGYDPEDQQSIENAFLQAMTFDRNTIDTSGILDWGDVLDRTLKTLS